MMTADFTINATHCKAYPANVLAQRGGKHIYSVKADKDMDNGTIVAINNWVEYDYFSVKESTGFAGKIVGKNVDGSWLVLVTNPGDGCFVYQKPLTPYETPKALKDEHTFFNKKDDIIRAYELAVGDRIALSDEGFTTVPTSTSIGKGVTVSSANRKLVIGA